MIVLDEQLLGRGLERDIAQWYRGTVQFITDLCPHTIIKDEAIPVLLRRQAQPTFVTINERDSQLFLLSCIDEHSLHLNGTLGVSLGPDRIERRISSRTA